jgi:uncharacterized OsmC-like protein
MTDVVYRSQVVLERLATGVRRAHLPGERQPVLFGEHGEVAKHYQREEPAGETHANTLDYVVAATAGCLLGTFGGALDARQIPAGERHLMARATGQVGLDGEVLVLRHIHVRLELRARPEHRAAAERVHGFFADHCPVYRSLKGGIQITTELVFVDV